LAEHSPGFFPSKSSQGPKRRSDVTTEEATSYHVNMDFRVSTPDD
jgi:hypothetical protein